ncbi:MAG: DUF2975 domain-containing protein [Prevotella sp.]|nr:DUF2975 domain-containing protein [Prevotella sp.]
MKQKEQLTNSLQQGVESIMDTGTMAFWVMGVGAGLLMLGEVATNSRDYSLAYMATIGATILSVVLCSIIAYRLLRNVKKGEVFTHDNVSLISSLGVSLRTVCMLLFVVAGADAYQHIGEQELTITSAPFMTAVFLGVLGNMFYLIAVVMKRGIAMQEEQALTI